MQDTNIENSDTDVALPGERLVMTVGCVLHSIMWKGRGLGQMSPISLC